MAKYFYHKSFVKEKAIANAKIKKKVRQSFT